MLRVNRWVSTALMPNIPTTNATLMTVSIIEAFVESSDWSSMKQSSGVPFALSHPDDQLKQQRNESATDKSVDRRFHSEGRHVQKPAHSGPSDQVYQKVKWPIAAWHTHQSFSRAWRFACKYFRGPIAAWRSIILEVKRTCLVVNQLIELVALMTVWRLPVSHDQFFQ